MAQRMTLRSGTNRAAAAEADVADANPPTSTSFIRSSQARSSGHSYPTRGLKPSSESILFCTFQICKDDRQSDPFGGGVIANVDVNPGDSFEDKAAFYMDGTPPSYLNSTRGEYIMYGNGYFRVPGSLTVMLNEPRNEQLPNMKFIVRPTSHDGVMVHTLHWKFIRHVHAGKEILVDYSQLSP